MTARALHSSLAKNLADRFRLRLETGLTLARTDRFVQELEPPAREEPDLFAALAAAFRTWRRAVREADADACMDAMEVTWSRLEACLSRVAERDALIQAFRVRWACENAALSYQTIDSLARFYRLVPFSAGAQSKYEYVLTRRLAGPLVPDRRLPPAEELVEAVVALEVSWGASPVKVEDAEVARVVPAIRAFGEEAGRQEDAAGFTASALLRRFGAFKASLGDKLFDPRLSVAVVETNVRVLNVLNQLLADAGGQPLRGAAAARRAPLPRPLRAERGEAPPVKAHLRTAEIDISGLELVDGRRAGATPSAPDPGRASEPDIGPLEPLLEAPGLPSPPEPASGITWPHADLRTGEVDLSGMEFVRRIRHPGPEPGSEAEPGASEPTITRAGGDDPGAEQDVERPGVPEDEHPGASEEEAGELAEEETEQQPSPRASELGKRLGNEALIEHYLTVPRSPEVWRLNLDSFLGGPDGDGSHDSNQGAERRRAFDLILAADDLICLRETQEGPPPLEHRARVKDLAQSMLRLQSSLRRAASLAQGGREEVEPLLYVSDHLLWERLRLSASLTRATARKRPPLRPRGSRTAEVARRQTRRLRRHRGLLVWAVSATVILAAIAKMMGVTAPGPAIDREVILLRVQDLPQPQIFVDARAFRNRLFITADLSWARLGPAERHSIVSSVGAFAAGIGLDTVSIVGPKGEALATFKDNQVMLASEVSELPDPKR